MGDNTELHVDERSMSTFPVCHHMHTAAHARRQAFTDGYAATRVLIVRFCEWRPLGLPGRRRPSAVTDDNLQFAHIFLTVVRMKAGFNKYVINRRRLQSVV